MPKKRVQIGPRLRPESYAILTELQKVYASEAKQLTPWSQSEALDRALMEVAERRGLKVPKT